MTMQCDELTSTPHTLESAPRAKAHDPPNGQTPYHVVQRAARRGLVPTYRLGTSRPYVRLRDFLDLMSRNPG
jgi:hypothetical protein